jgi:hypothetical protein
VTLAGIELMHMIRKGQLKAAGRPGEPVLFVGRLTCMLGTGLLRRAPGFAIEPSAAGPAETSPVEFGSDVVTDPAHVGGGPFFQSGEA